MAIYTVLEPAPGSTEGATTADRAVFVRDGFHWYAFFFGAFWMLWYRLWLVLLGYLLLLGASELVFWVTGAPSTVRTIVGLLIALLIGLEAPTLRRWTLLRRGWRERGIIVADDHGAAEHRYFAGGIVAPAPAARAAAPGNSVPPSVAANYPRPPASAALGVVGLFPTPGGHR